MEVCICCGGSSIKPSSEASDIARFRSYILLKNSKYYCTECDNYTELVTLKEYKKGYSLIKEVRTMLIDTLNEEQVIIKAAEKLGISERTIFRYMKDYNIERKQYCKYV